MARDDDRRRSPYSSGFHWAMIAFLGGYLILLLGLSYFYLIPAFRAAQDAGPAERDQLAAYSALLLVVVLTVLVVGLLLTFRIRRYFVSGPKPSEKTKSIDAWKESGSRGRGE